nr:acyl-CoA Delta(11) desaturase-like [Onthophagus taurus]XP_022919345.1 acyl-CoA Delta(11) desaturase-like [Onthophagus taurus]XP_022919347.1 acyl-CoA Delta(11) desaturase-like [Onthophagus taurus]XP_022919348.1 acyl-CoA Delta(11) desaturase-like [Onthophagus taurus]
MPPNETGVLHETDIVDTQNVNINNHETKPREYKYVWRNIILYIYLHVVSFYGVYVLFTSAKFLTIILGFILLNMGNLGITCGAHRLWSHKSYKAKTPLKILLVIMQTLAFQNSAIEWARDHRVHHKFSETNADPHNATRGFFFSHVGWLLTRRHPDVKEKGKGVDISDLTSDPILRFQQKHYVPLMIFTSFVLPTVLPMYLWNEGFVNAWVLNLLRYCLGLNITWLVNSVAHMFGDKPYDKFINPGENFSVALLALGEGWHNYHHTFPWDYKTSELGKYSTNMSTLFIDFMAKIGWAYDLKTVSEDMIKKRVKRTGDGTHNLWGWTDKDMPKEDIQDAITLNKKCD